MASLKLLERWHLCAYSPLELYFCWLFMYTSTLEKTECKMLFKRVTRRNGASSAVSSSSAFTSSLCSFLLLCYCKFRNHDPWQISVSRPSTSVSNQRNSSDPLEIQTPAVFIEWGSIVDLIFMEREDIINYWDFPSNTSRNCRKKLLPKITRHDEWEMFAKMSLCDRLICFADFVGMILLALPLLLPLPNCFLSVCFPTLFAADSIYFLTLTTSAISGSANSKKSAPTRFAAGTIYLRKNGIAVLPIPCASGPNPRPRCRPISLLNGISTCLEATNF